MRLSRAFIPTLKEIPADATAPSHVLMLRAGMVRQLMAGVYTHLPFGWRIINKIMGLIREEMNAIGGQEFHLPALNPRDVWDQTGRPDDFGPVMFNLTDRKGKKLCLGPTHEEIICYHARDSIHSYRDMPQIWYQIQMKFRDEERPRGGVLRGRQFIMKDSYTLTADTESLDHAYNLHRQAYINIFRRAGLDFFIVGASSGVMGGSGSEEFMGPSASGEDNIARCTACGYAANVEIAQSSVEPVIYDEEPLEKIPTPDQRTIESLVEFLGIPIEKTAKSRVYVDAQNKPVLVLVRGDYEVNDEKLIKHLGNGFRPAHPEEVREFTGADIGSIGPIGFKGRIFADVMLKGCQAMVSGANENDFHYKGISLERDADITAYEDIRVIKEGEACIRCGKPLEVMQCIELGHIFKLGTKYSVAMHANFLDESGTEHPIIMGSYGIGLERIAATAVEQSFDEYGIVWPVSIAPFHVHLLCANVNIPEVKQAAEDLYGELVRAGIEVLYDDRDASAGFKFKDADLIGVPYRVTVGKKGVEKGIVELTERKLGKDSRRDIAPGEVVRVISDMIATELTRLNADIKRDIDPVDL